MRSSSNWDCQPKGAATRDAEFDGFRTIRSHLHDLIIAQRSEV